MARSEATAAPVRVFLEVVGDIAPLLDRQFALFGAQAQRAAPHAGHNICIHTVTCVLALQIVHLMRREANHSGEHHSVGELLDRLAWSQETVLIHPSTGGQPKARRMLTETTETQNKLTDVFNMLWL